MIEIRPSEERGHNKISWLDSRFTFSFDQYYHPGPHAVSFAACDE